MGVVFWEIIYGKPPYEDKSIYGLIQKIDNIKLILPAHTRVCP